jgi:hypothetical protein
MGANRDVREAQKYGNAEAVGKVAFGLVGVAGAAYLLWGPKTTYSGQVSQAIWDRAFTNVILDLLRIAVIILAAFVAGGIAQRVWLGDFSLETSIFKLAPVVGASIQRTADDLNKATSQAVARLQEQTTNQIDKLAGIVEESVANQQKGLADLTTKVDALTDSVADLRQRFDALQAPKGGKI